MDIKDVSKTFYILIFGFVLFSVVFMFYSVFTDNLLSHGKDLLKYLKIQLDHRSKNNFVELSKYESIT